MEAEAVEKLQVKYGYATCLPHRDGGVKCLVQGHNKQACWLILQTIPYFMLSAKQESCEYHFLKSFGMTGLGK